MSILKYLPIPSLRFSIFAGTNTFNEAILAFKLWLKREHQNLKVIKQYEAEFAKATQTTTAYSFATGRMSLFAALKALDLKEGDEIILPAFTCVVVPNALLYLGIKPIYVDIEDQFFNIDPSLIEEKITSKTKAIYAQHTFGNICQIDKLKALADKYSLYIIEDSAHALDNELEGVKVGGLGDISFFSTDHSKVINTGFGGMVCTNNHELAKKLEQIQHETPFLSHYENQKILRVFFSEYFLYFPLIYWLGRFIINLLGRVRFFTLFPDEKITKIQDTHNYPSRLSSSVAEIGIQQLLKLKRNVAHRKTIAKGLHELLPTVAYQSHSTFLRFTFLVRDRSLFINHHRLNYDLGIWFDSIFQGRVEGFEEVGYIKNSCPIAEKCANHIVNYPTHLHIKPSHVFQSLISFQKTHPLQIVRSVNEL